MTSIDDMLDDRDIMDGEATERVLRNRRQWLDRARDAVRSLRLLRREPVWRHAIDVVAGDIDELRRMWRTVEDLWAVERVARGYGESGVSDEEMWDIGKEAAAEARRVREDVQSRIGDVADRLKLLTERERNMRAREELLRQDAARRTEERNLEEARRYCELAELDDRFWCSDWLDLDASLRRPAWLGRPAPTPRPMQRAAPITASLRPYLSRRMSAPLLRPAPDNATNFPIVTAVSLIPGHRIERVVGPIRVSLPVLSSTTHTAADRVALHRLLQDEALRRGANAIVGVTSCYREGLDRRRIWARGRAVFVRRTAA